MSSNLRDTSDKGFSIHPLSRRTRPGFVVEELKGLVGLSAMMVLRKACDQDRKSQLSKEALVTVLRNFLAQGDRDKADRVFLEIVSRVAGAISNKLVTWSGIAGAENEDTRQAVVLGLHEYLYSLDAGEELWECNFKTCFDMRLLTIFGRLTRAMAQTVSADAVDAHGEASDAFDIADPASDEGFQKLEVAEAIKHLNRVDPKLAKVFYWKFFADFAEKEIASMMDVNERTVRNWITNSRKTLLEYYAELRQ